MALLDRDGTIVHDRRYLNDPAGLEFLPRAAEGLARLHELGFRLAVISNQSGVGRGLISMSQLEGMNRRLAAMFAEVGVPLAGIFCCPHSPDENCRCRKPQPGLVEMAAAELVFDARTSVVIGDRKSDIELGRRVGATTVLIRAASDEGLDLRASFVAADLLEAADLLL